MLDTTAQPLLEASCCCDVPSACPLIPYTQRLLLCSLCLANKLQVGHARSTKLAVCMGWAGRRHGQGFYTPTQTPS